MSESSVPAQSPLAGTSPFGPGSHDYRLSDDLARLCLPRELKEPYRHLAWTNSICFLFLVIGIVGLKTPRLHVRPLSEPPDIVPVVFTPPPEELPKVEPEVKPDEPDQPRDTQEDTPQVVQVVAAADSSAVAFAVPVQGAVAVASEARLATPPPPVPQAPPRPVAFNPNAATGGSFPPPDYPPLALRNRWHGTAVVEIKVDPDGKTTDVKLQRSSGYSVLDEAAMEVVSKRWHFPASGKPEWYYYPFLFQIQ